MTNAHVDAVLAAADRMLQRHTVAPPTEAGCVHCHRSGPVRPSGLCEACRAWMAGETDADPRTTTQTHAVHPSSETLAVAMAEAYDAFADDDDFEAYGWWVMP